jgi:hypothetical protein
MIKTNASLSAWAQTHTTSPRFYKKSVLTQTMPTASNQHHYHPQRHLLFRFYPYQRAKTRIRERPEPRFIHPPWNGGKAEFSKVCFVNCCGQSGVTLQLALLSFNKLKIRFSGTAADLPSNAMQNADTMRFSYCSDMF